MIYKFKSKAAGDVIMTAPVGDKVLRAMGREPAPKGIFEAAALPGLLAALEAAVANDEAQRAAASDGPAGDGADGPHAEGVALKLRAWPMIEMLRRCAAAKTDIVWGV